MAKTPKAAPEAPAPVPAPAPAPAPAPEAPTDYLVGMRKVGPDRYALVRYKIQGDDILEMVVSPVADPIQFTAKQLQNACLELVRNIP